MIRALVLIPHALHSTKRKVQLAMATTYEFYEDVAVARVLLQHVACATNVSANIRSPLEISSAPLIAASACRSGVEPLLHLRCAGKHAYEVEELGLRVMQFRCFYHRTKPVRPCFLKRHVHNLVQVSTTGPRISYGFVCVVPQDHHHTRTFVATNHSTEITFATVHNAFPNWVSLHAITPQNVHPPARTQFAWCCRGSVNSTHLGVTSARCWHQTHWEFCLCRLHLW
mmetsp:Transcript_49207/g.130305  ORF Transcript_49207/g.130305 Transcript_49207/m.130305 type:complete len:227 (-) Transcript_49207:726-1406(-)